MTQNVEFQASFAALEFFLVGLKMLLLPTFCWKVPQG